MEEDDACFIVIHYRYDEKDPHAAFNALQYQVRCSTLFDGAVGIIDPNFSLASKRLVAQYRGYVYVVGHLPTGYMEAGLTEQAECLLGEVRRQSTVLIIFERWIYIAVAAPMTALLA